MYSFEIVQDGVVVACGDAEELKELLQECQRYIFSYIDEGIDKVVIKKG